MFRKLLCIAFVTFALLSFHQAAADEATEAEASATEAAASDAEQATEADESSTEEADSDDDGDDELPNLLNGLDWPSLIDPQDIEDEIAAP